MVIYDKDVSGVLISDCAKFMVLHRQHKILIMDSKNYQLITEFKMSYINNVFKISNNRIVVTSESSSKFMIIDLYSLQSETYKVKCNNLIGKYFVDGNLGLFCACWYEKHYKDYPTKKSIKVFKISFNPFTCTEIFDFMKFNNKDIVLSDFIFSREINKYIVFTEEVPYVSVYELSIVDDSYKMKLIKDFYPHFVELHYVQEVDALLNITNDSIELTDFNFNRIKTCAIKGIGRHWFEATPSYDKSKLLIRTSEKFIILDFNTFKIVSTIDFQRLNYANELDVIYCGYIFNDSLIYSIPNKLYALPIHLF